MALSEWLSSQGVTHIVMERRHLLEAGLAYLSDGEFELVLANAAHVKNVPVARPTSTTPHGWRLMAHGLIRASFVPDEPTNRCAICFAPASR